MELSGGNIHMYLCYIYLLVGLKNTVPQPIRYFASAGARLYCGKYSLNRSNFELEMIRGNHDKHSCTALSRNFAIDDFIHDAVSSPR